MPPAAPPGPTADLGQDRLDPGQITGGIHRQLHRGVIGRGAASGAIAGGLQPTAPGTNYATEKARDVTAGAAGGAVGGAVGGVGIASGSALCGNMGTSRNRTFNVVGPAPECTRIKPVGSPPPSESSSSPR